MSLHATRLPTDKLIQLHWIGRFGNRLFQYVFGCQYARDNALHYFYPSQWEGSVLFCPPPPYVTQIPDEQLRREVNQTAAQMDTTEYRRGAVERYSQRTGDVVEFVDFCDQASMGKRNACFDDLAMMYMPWLLNGYDARLWHELLCFSDDVLNSRIYADLCSRRGTYDAAHVRRGDIAHTGFTGVQSPVSLQAYRAAMCAAGVDPDDVVWVSDDPRISSISAWQRLIVPPDSWSYPVGQEPLQEVFFSFLPDFLTLLFARRLFRSNSSFSWWAACLSQGDIFSPDLRIVHGHAQDGIICAFVEGNHPHFMTHPGRDFGDLPVNRACRELPSN
jgi:hypothetical protein